MKYICLRFNPVERYGEIYINAEDISAVEPTEVGVCTITTKSRIVYHNVQCDANVLVKTIVNCSDGVYYF